MDNEAATNDLIDLAIEVAQKGAGGITRLITSTYFTFQVEGEELVFTEELRAQVEAKLGEPLVERVFAGLEGEVALVPATQVAAATLSDLRAQAASGRFKQNDDIAFFASPLVTEDSGINVRKLIERTIIRRAVTDVLAIQAEDGPAYAISVFDGEQTTLIGSRDVGQIMGAVMTTNEDMLIVRRLHQDRGSSYFGSIALAYGNDGWDVIRNHHRPLDEILAGTKAMADAIGRVI
ncbi:hypothetical protein BLA13014_07581 [Burkholderia aenigmatica]|uniref:Uncharacterized protein n=1 Tax=Burkholderia aenigmatica TaxID=2015348 RepID=A0A6P2SW05_9BURK|nr:hypothetical protein [Burkholderia aenigmatica]VWC49314.1 hypothetical protein BLA13014_07581 [Burkholderia aenigmatica]